MTQHQEATHWLGHARALRRRVRVESLPSWFPLLVFGLVVCGAVPFYVAAVLATSPGGVSFVDGGLTFFGGVQPAWYVSVYWLVSIPAAYALAALFFRRRANKVGVGDRSVPFTAVGLALFGGLLLLYSPFGLDGPWSWTPGNLLVRGLLPLLAISLALGSLAVIARSFVLGVFAAGFVGLTLMANLYNMENLVFRLGWTPSSDLQWGFSGYVGLAACGITLLAAGGVSFLRSRLARGSSR